MQPAAPEIAVYGARTLYNRLKQNRCDWSFVTAAARAGACPYCRYPLEKWDNEDFLPYIRKIESPLLEDSRDEDGDQIEDYIAFCHFCGFWIGEGTRYENGPHMHRVVHGKTCKFDINADEVSTEDLVRHLHRNHNRIGSLNPFRAERFVVDLLREVLGWDVERVGGVKDKGVDGYVIADGHRRGLIQIKWHGDHRGSFPVKVVREIMGTMIARGVPSGVIVSTKEKLSVDAERELWDAAHSPLLISPLHMEYIGYRDLLSMLDLASQTIGQFNGPPQQAIDIIMESRNVGGWKLNTFFDRWEDEVY